MPGPGAKVFKPLQLLPIIGSLPRNAAEYASSGLPLLNITSLQLKGGGTCLVMCISHSVADLTSLRLFTRHWSQQYTSLQQGSNTAAAAAAAAAALPLPAFGCLDFDLYARQGLPGASSSAAASPATARSPPAAAAPTATSHQAHDTSTSASSSDSCPFASEPPRRLFVPSSFWGTLHLMASLIRNVVLRPTEDVFIHMGHEELHGLRQQAMQQLQPAAAQAGAATSGAAAGAAGATAGAAAAAGPGPAGSAFKLPASASSSSSSMASEAADSSRSSSVPAEEWLAYDEAHEREAREGSHGWAAGLRHPAWLQSFAALPGGPWVSTSDTMWARLWQLLGAVPARAGEQLPGWLALTLARPDTDRACCLRMCASLCHMSWLSCCHGLLHAGPLLQLSRLRATW